MVPRDWGKNVAYHPPFSRYTCTNQWSLGTSNMGILGRLLMTNSCCSCSSLTSNVCLPRNDDIRTKGLLRNGGLKNSLWENLDFCFDTPGSSEYDIRRKVEEARNATRMPHPVLWNTKILQAPNLHSHSGIYNPSWHLLQKRKQWTPFILKVTGGWDR